ncbi:hypothetical protein [Nostoc sp.]|uniref:hypothetical protein n=1 Tax=Nostoc sp. TaxID=1180 RepID=UPI002FF88229
MVSANIAGWDLGSVIKYVRDQVKQIQLPGGYYVQFGGQFQAQEQATQTLIAGTIMQLYTAQLSPTVSWY